MNEPGSIYREDEREGVPITPLRSLYFAATLLADAIGRDTETTEGTCFVILDQNPPPELAGAVAALVVLRDALGAQLRRVDEVLYAGACHAGGSHRGPLPGTRIIVQHIHRAVGHLADVLLRWCVEAEMQADALDEAVRLVATGQARVVVDDLTTTILPTVATTATEGRE